MAGVKSRPRVVVENVQPEIDGRFAIKRVVGETVEVEADVFADGHDEISVALLHRPEKSDTWISLPMKALGNDRWTGKFIVTEMGPHRYTVRGWIDAFKTWRRDLVKRLQAGQDVAIELIVGADLMVQAASRAGEGDALALRKIAAFVRGPEPPSKRANRALDEDVQRLVSLYPDLQHAAHAERELPLWVDRERARYSTWYELFPRSFAREP